MALKMKHTSTGGCALQEGETQPSFCSSAASEWVQQQRIEWSSHVTPSVSSCGRKKWAARDSTISIPESNLFSLFPQTYIFTDEEDGALKRRMGNDL